MVVVSLTILHHVLASGRAQCKRSAWQRQPEAVTSAGHAAALQGYALECKSRRAVNVRKENCEEMS